MIRFGNELEVTSEARLNRLERIGRLLVRAGMRERTLVREHEDKINILFNAQIKTEESLVTLAEAQTHTDHRLDALIDIIRGDR
jgi:hypothetical protein